MLKKYLLESLILGTLASPCFAQNVITLDGSVVDADTHRPISAANVTVRGLKIVTSTDSLGQFKLSLASGSYVVAFSHIAYDKVIKGITADKPMSFTWRVEMTPHPIQLGEVTVTGKKPFSQQRALHSLSAAEFERLGESDMDRAMRYLLPTIISPWDVRMRFPLKDFTLYINGEWKESIYLTDLDPYAVQRVLIWEGEWSPVGFPLRRGKYVVSIDTK